VRTPALLPPLPLQAGIHRLTNLRWSPLYPTDSLEFGDVAGRLRFVATMDSFAIEANAALLDAEDKKAEKEEHAAAVTAAARKMAAAAMSAAAAEVEAADKAAARKKQNGFARAVSTGPIVVGVPKQKGPCASLAAAFHCCVKKG